MKTALLILLGAAFAFGQSEKPYVLGPGDQLSIQVTNVEEYTGKAVRIDDGGGLILPLIGRVAAAGSTVAELTATLTERLAKYVVKPEVTITIAERRTMPVTVSGAVKTPGVLNVSPGKTLFEVLAMAGGIQQDAGYRIHLTRRVSSGSIPLESAQKDATGENFTADISLKNLEDGSAAENVAIQPNDFIAVPRAQLVWVIGDMKRTGGFALAEGQTVSVLEAVAMAEGPLHTADLSKASIQRVGPNDKRTVIQVDLKKIMTQKAPDVQLQAKDILIVPGSSSHSVLDKTLSAIVTIGSGSIIRLY
jgi:polysaccharide export outer membrane protein